MSSCRSQDVFAFVCLALFVCLMGRATAQGDPIPKEEIKSYVIDLDAEPEIRWAHVVKEHNLAIHGLLDILRGAFKPKMADIDQLIFAYNESVSDEYRREMSGIAKAAGLSFHDTIMANMFYEVTGVVDTPLDTKWGPTLARSCCSIVGQNNDGTVYLARNQDYPPPFTLVMIKAVFTRGGKKIYEGTTYAGTIGLSTGFVPGGWSASINARGNPGKGTTAGLKHAIDAIRGGAQVGPVFVRQAMDALAHKKSKGGLYDQALAFYCDKPLIMPIYIIVAGVRAGDGGIITRNATAAGTHGLGDYFSLFTKEDHDSAGGAWFTVQTNTDHWVKNGAHSRRSTAVAGMEKIGPEKINLEGLWRVLDTPPTYNAATIHTDLTCPASGEYYTYKRHGPL